MVAVLAERQTSPFLSLALVTSIAALCYLLLPMQVRSATVERVQVDIDIGTNGKTITSTASKLITFDPTDTRYISDSLLRYPYVISDFDGFATFYVNDEEPGCSSINVRNEAYDRVLQSDRIRSRCGDVVFQRSRLFKCMHSKKLRATRVTVRRLSSVLREMNVDSINVLKIDAQGSDFAIVKDVFENLPGVAVRRLQVECQEYNVSTPLYFSANDCGAILSYVRQKFPAMSYRRVLNNCMAAEYNLVMNISDH